MDEATNINGNETVICKFVNRASLRENNEGEFNHQREQKTQTPTTATPAVIDSRSTKPSLAPSCYRFKHMK
jgi:hypothetical protein